MLQNHRRPVDLEPYNIRILPVCLFRLPHLLIDTFQTLRILQRFKSFFPDIRINKASQDILPEDLFPDIGIHIPLHLNIGVCSLLNRIIPCAVQDQLRRICSLIDKIGIAGLDLIPGKRNRTKPFILYTVSLNEFKPGLRVCRGVMPAVHDHTLRAGPDLLSEIFGTCFRVRLAHILICDT